MGVHPARSPLLDHLERHRSPSIRSAAIADQVLVLNGGRIVEQGAHAQLLARGGLYAALYRAHGSEADADFP